MNDQWNASVVTPEDAGSGTKVLDSLEQVQPTLSAGSNITIAEGEISASGTLENVQANWSETDPSDPSYIKNKPTIPAAQVNSDWNAESGVAQILNKPTLATVATSGSYNDLSGKPSIPAAQVQSDWSQSNDQSVDYIKNKPTIPSVDQTYNSASTNAQSGTAVAGAIATVRQVPSTQSSDNGKVLGVTDTSGSLGWVDQPADELPSITGNGGKVLKVNSGATGVEWATESGGGGTVDQTYNASSTNAQSGTAVAGAIDTVRQVPSTQSSDNGKILGVVDANGTMAWVDKPVSNVTTADKKFNVGVNGTGYPVEISYNATLGSIPGSKDLAVKSYDASSFTTIAVVLKSWNYAQDGGLSVGNVAKLVIPESGSFGVYGEYLRIDYYNSTNGNHGSFIFLGGEDTGDGWPAYMNDMVYVAGTYDLPVVSTASGDQTCDSIMISLQLSDIDASAAAIAAAKAHMEEVMAGWTIQWPVNTTSYNVSIPDIPAVTSADNNKVLTATWNSSTSTGSFGWATAGGGGSASISDIVRDIDASNPQAGQTDSAFFGGLISDIQAGKLVRLVANQMSGDTYTEYAFLDRYYLDGNDSSFYFYSHRYSYLMTWDGVWSVCRYSNS